MVPTEPPLLDFFPMAAAKPPAAAPPIKAMIRNFLPAPPPGAGSALISEITALAVAPRKEAVTWISKLPSA